MSDRSSHGEAMLLDFDGWMGSLPEDSRRDLEWHLSSVPASMRQAEKDRLASMQFASDATGLDLDTVNDQWDTVRAGLAEHLAGVQDEIGWREKDRLASALVAVDPTEYNEDVGLPGFNTPDGKAAAARATAWKEARDDEAAFAGRAREYVGRSRDERILVEGMDTDDEAGRATRERSLVSLAQQAAVEGKPYQSAFSTWQLASGKRGTPGFEPTNLARYEATARAAHGMMAAEMSVAQPVADIVWRELAKDRGAEEGATQPGAALAAMRGLSPLQKQLVGQILQRRGEKEAPDKGFWQATGEGLFRGAENLLAGGGTAAWRDALLLSRDSFEAGTMVSGTSAVDEVSRAFTAESLTASGPNTGGAGFARLAEPKRALSAEEAEKWNADIAGAIEDVDTADVLRKLGQSAVDPIKGGSGFRQKFWQPAVESIPLMASLSAPGAAVIPIAALNARSYQNDEYQRLRGIGMDAGEANQRAAVAGGLQSALDFFQARKLATALPSVGRLLTKANLSMTTMTRGIVGGLSETAEQTAIELMQDHIVPAAVQDIAQANPGFDPKWGEVLRDTLKAVPDTVMGMALLSGFSAVHAARTDAQAIADLTTSPAAMRLSGFTPAAISEIQAAPAEAKGELLAQHLPTKPPTDEERAAIVADVQRLAAEESAKAKAAADKLQGELDQAGVSITRLPGVEAPTYRVTGTEGEVSEHGNPEDAMAAARTYMDAADINREAPFLDAMASFVQGAAPGESFEINRESRSLQSVLDAAEQAGDSLTVDAVWNRLAVERAKQANPELQPADLTVLGESVTDFKGGVATYTARLWDGAGVLDLAEEKSENDVRRWISAGRTSWGGLAGMIGDVQDATGETFLHGFDAAAGETEANKTAVIEAYSSLVRAYALGVASPRGGKVTKGARGETLTQARGLRQALRGAERQGVAPQLMRALRETYEYFRQVLIAVARVRTAAEKGQLGEVESFLRESLKLDEELQHAEGVEAAAGEIFIPDPDYSPPTADEAAQGRAFSLRPARLDAGDRESRPALEEGEIQQYFDFHGVPQEKAKKGKKAFKAAGLGVVPPRGGGPDTAAVDAARRVAERAWRGLIGGDLTQRDAALQAIEQGPVSSIMHQFISRAIPQWDVRGAKIETPADLHQLLLAVRSPYFESLKVAVVDENNVVIGSRILTVGGLSESSAGTREILAGVQELIDAHKGTQVGGFLIAHNHPSGNPMPSTADQEVTRRLVDAGHTFGVPLIDHVVTNGEAYFSFREGGILSPPSPNRIKGTPPAVQPGQPAPAAAPLAGKKLADWEVVPRKDKPAIGNQTAFKSFAKQFQTTDPDHAHIVYTDTKIQITAVERVEVTDLPAAAQMISKGVAREGAAGIFISLPQGIMPKDVEASIQKLEIAARDIGARIHDVIGFNDTWGAQSRAYGAGITFSLSPRGRIEAVANALGRAMEGDPNEKRRLLAAAQGKLLALADRYDKRKAPWSTPRSEKSIREERNFREAARREELEDEVYRNHADVLGAPGFSDLWSRPIFALFAKPGDPLHGRIMSRTQALRRGKFDPSLHGDFDGADGVPRIVFGGQRMPDQAAQEAFDAGLITDASPDALWNALRAEAADVAKWKALEKAAADDLKQARTTAAKEAKAWEAEQLAAQKRDHSPKAQLLRDMRTLDALLAVFPVEVRAKVGGYLNLAKFTTDDNRFAEIERRVQMLGKVVEQHLRRTNMDTLAALIQKARPAADEPGQTKRGKITVQGHRYFARAEQYAAVSLADLPGVLKSLEAERDRLAAESVAGVVNRELIEAEETLSIAEMFGGFAERTAAEQETALDAMSRVYRTGRNAWLAVLEARAANDARLTQLALESLAKELGVRLPAFEPPRIPEGASGAERSTLLDAAQQAHALEIAKLFNRQPIGTKARRQRKKAEAQSEQVRTLLQSGRLDLVSLPQLLDALLGRKHPLTQHWERAVRTAAAQRTDGDAARIQRFEAKLKAVFKTKRLYQARQRLFDMRTRQSITFDKLEGRGPEREYSVPADKIEAMIEGRATVRALGLTEAEAEFLMDAWADNRAAHRNGLARLREKFEVLRQSAGVPTATSITEAEAIGLTLLYRQTQYVKNFGAAGYTPEAMESIEDSLSKEAKDIREFLAAEYAEEHGSLNAVFMNLFGIDLPRVPNYSPARFERSGKEVMIDQSGEILVDADMKTGMLRTRDPHHRAAPAGDDAFSTFREHFAATEHWKAFAPLVREMTNVLGNLHVKNAIKAAYGESMLSAVQAWQEAVARGGLQSRSGIRTFDRIASGLGKNQALTALAGRASTLAKNLLAALPMAARLGVGTYTRGVGRLLSGKLAIGYKEALASPTMQRRILMSPEIRAALASDTLHRPTASMAGAETLTEWIGHVDAWATTVGAAISYDHHFHELIRTGASEAFARAEAAERMNEDVNRTAQPTEFVDRSLTELSASPAARLAFMMFASEARKGWALVQEAVVGFFQGKVSAAEAANVAAVAWLAVGLLEATISAAFRDAQDGDDAEWLDSDNWGWRLWTQAATGPFSGIPLVRDVIGGGKSGPTGKAVRGGKAAIDIGKLLAGDENAQAQFDRHPWEWWEEKVVAVLNGLGFIARGAVPAAVAANIGDQLFKGVDNFTATAEEAEEIELKRLRAKDREAREAAGEEKTAATKEERAERRKKELERLRAKYPGVEP